MTIEDQLREYRATLDAETERAAASHLPHAVVPIRVRPARTLLVAAVAVAATVAVAFAAGGVTHHSSTPPVGSAPSTRAAVTTTSAASPIRSASTVVVPNVVGENPLTIADSTLRAVGLKVRTIEPKFCSSPSNVVATQRPAAGTRVAVGSQVTLGVCELSVTTKLPVVVCNTEYGTSPTASDPKAPTSLTIAAPPFATPRLSGYSDLRGYMAIAAPAGWNCKALEATDGGQAVGVTPPGVTPRESWGVGGTVTQPPTDGVFAQSDGACQGCAYGDVCSIVPTAATEFPDYASTPGLCKAPPVGQHVTPLGNNLYRIDDPAGALGPDAAESILRYAPKTATTDPGDARLTCILPASEHAVCDALIADFLALHPSVG